MTQNDLPTVVDPGRLLARLDRLAEVLQAEGHAMALIGLGSVGLDTERLDAHSDLDFFVIVEPGWKQRYLDSLDWLSAAHPVAWSFPNTADGHKALMADGVLCEFAVFEPSELTRIPYAPGRLVWARSDADPRWAVPSTLPSPRTPPGTAWIVGEALSCLLVGLKRWHRGERLSAARFVQGHAVDRLLELDAQCGGTSAAAADPFNAERRIERRSPTLAEELPTLVPGYDRTPEAALALLDALRRRGATLDDSVVALIQRLAGQGTH